MDSTLLWIVTIIGGIIAIIKGAFSLLQYIVKNIVNPLSFSITNLQQATQELRNLIDRLRNDMQALDKRIIICEQSTKSAHRRLDWVCTVIDRPEGLHRGGRDEDD